MVVQVAFQQDALTLSGGEDDWTPNWSWHGFRYIEVTVPHHMAWGPEVSPSQSATCGPLLSAVGMESR